MDAFRYEEHELCCEEVPLSELVEEFGTPLYVYSRKQIIQNFRTLEAPLAGTDHLVCYALKANANPALLKLLAQEGAGADVVSSGELYFALMAGFAPERITFAGVGKRDDEIEYALKNDIYSINTESAQELQIVSLVALRLGKKARVTLRVNPDIDAQSHPYITTGLKQNKFGVPAEEALGIFQYAATLPNLEVIGVHAHIGSQITRVEPFVEAARFLAGMVRSLREAGLPISHLDFGGGFGVQYLNALACEGLPQESDAIPVPPLNLFIEGVLPVLQETGCTLWFEPGRSIVANSGALLTKVLYTKENGLKKFVVVDAGMNDLLRPSLYNAYHQVVPLKLQTYEHERVDVVGPICETGDFLARDRSLNKSKRDDVLAVMTAGAYGFSLSSNYNARLRPAEVLVNGDKVRVIRERQTIEQLL
ncbi:MAG: diaminopimelate decarboxylase [Ignavibacteriales bacterium]|nr:diaminopimelate decarboxylase [Ignavibacteriales bacterium]